ncbi:DNA-directed RNA polymerase, mitochondrial isoform X3 [Plutella xylostella]|uniref:DNA-directed RNA polymerase, mitochondrial isoform X1 n=1 Tax=Plutella xylostella TaxID=51655 RepID=UPI002032B0BF|nr:DNA-directed RNA polymerase, mitochondrial isoform X1 [Plutella xylostella]XP_048479580.1 DNA-directed RNA polymerase, mitochondrial isoform X2 [Plutella xylostella]XP_048479584.1 DNA-directed RNA polymerase, mitochondrial isoform X3 [Plutella xylostella]
MYRLLSARNVYHSGFHNNVVISTNTNFQNSTIPEIKCSFCRKIRIGRQNIDNFAVRHQSTRPASAPQKALKKKTKYKKRYGELLEVGDKAMKEMKVSINKLRADQLSKLASSSVSLGQLHRLTTKTPNTTKEVDTDLLQSIKNKLLNKPATTSAFREISLEDDKCALIFTNHGISSLEERIKTKQYIDMVKESYYNFRKATLYDQKLQDLQYAINEGLNQEFDLAPDFGKNKTNISVNDDLSMPKGAHAVFKELFFEKDIDSYDQDLVTQLSSLPSQDLVHPLIEDIDEEGALLGEMAEVKDEWDLDHHEPDVQGLNIKKAKQALKAKKKAKRTAKLALAQEHMKESMRAVEARGKQHALHRLLGAHLQLLCALRMTHQGRQVLQYYRLRGSRVPEHPKVTDVKIYNTLLHGYAGMGSYKEVQEILSWLTQDDIAWSAQTYAAAFECVERSQLPDPVAVLREYRQKMESEGITLNDLLDKSVFENDQREVVLKAIRRLEPDFEPVYTPPDLDYNCPLLNDLNLEHTENRLGLAKSPAEGLFTVEELIERGKKQLEIEIKGDIEVKNIDIKDDSSPAVTLHRTKLRETEEEWRKVIKEAFVRNLSTLKSQSNASHTAITLYPYLKVLEEEQIVELVMGEISKLVDGSESYSPTLKLLQRDLGAQVYNKYQISQYRRNGVLKKTEEVFAQYCAWYATRGSLDGTGRAYNCRQAWQLLVHRNREGASLDLEETPWPVEIRQNIGKFLYNIIINDVKIDVNMFKTKGKEKKLPAVYKVHRPWGRLVRLELKPHPVLARLWAGAARPSLAMRAALLPSVAPAAPWAQHNKGAYLVTHTPLIRMPVNVVQQWRRVEAAGPMLRPALDSLNQLGEVPWRVDAAVLDLQLQVFRSGGNKKLDIPPPPSALDPTAFPPAESKPAAFRRRLAVSRARAEMYSLWCDALYKLSLANHYRDDIFWLPHNLDFRGRVYACPPHLSQLGADSARALLKFANKRPLGPHGLKWLKLHAINLTGTMKKKTVEERLKYADSVLDLILDSADNPLTGKRWWAQSEEPWQTLAACMEIANAVRSPNHEEYLSGFPVHQDGSCNGLQHYAALGGDAAGAAAVNLAPLPGPRDVYSATAARVEEMRARDAAAGVAAAQALEGFVRRKVIKQTVMTTVYGVTRFGARLQIAKQLKDIDEFPKEHVWSCSQYLTARTFDSLREMFTSTKQIQDWFTDCAKLISGVCGESVEWITPLGLPVVQPYYRRSGPSTAQCKAPLDHQQRPCTMKQRNAFPPNFIHSLDSTHMMLTSLRCQARAVTFVSVHDCFWTHPDTVDRMNKICREQFVALHSQPILEELSDFLVKRYSYPESEITGDSAGAANKRRVNKLLQRVPEKGDFQLQNVLDSVYFFS